MFSSRLLADTVHWGEFLRDGWTRGFPPEVVGTPRWVEAIGDLVSDDDRNARARSVMKKLKRTAPRSYDVMYRALIRGDSIPEISKFLNERAQRNHIPLPPGQDVHYTDRDTLALLVSGITFCRVHW